MMKARGIFVAVAASALALSGAAWADDYSTTGSGNWTDPIWNPVPPDPFYPWSGDTATLNSGHAVLMHWYADWGGTGDSTWPSDLTIVMDGGELQWYRYGGVGPGVLESLVKVKSDSSFLGTLYAPGEWMPGLRSTIADYDVGVTGTLTLSGSGKYLSITGGDRSGFSGGWDLGANDIYFGWSWTNPGTGDQLLGTGPVSMDGGSLQFYNNAGTVSNTITFGANGGKLQVGGAGQSGTVECAGEVTLGGQLDLDGQTGSITLSGKVTGTGKITTAKIGTGAGPTYKLTNTTSDFSGGVEVGGATFLVDVDGVLGSGPVTVNGGSFSVAVDVTPPAGGITVNTGGTITNLINRSDGANTLTTDFTADGGTVAVGGAADAEYSGTITLAGNSYFNAASRDLYASGDITGGAMLAKTGTRMLVLASANTLTGGMTAAQGTIRVDAVGGLGTGTAAAAGGTIQSNVADAFASASAVVSEENGTVELNSNENAAWIRINAGGGFQTLAGFTGTLDYSGTPNASATNVVVEAGAILDSGLPSFPTAGQFLPGDGGYGAFLAATSGTWSVGTASGTIYRGLAATSGSPTFDGSVTETALGTEGIGMLATGPATFNYTNATFTSANTNTIKFYGAGNHVINAGNSFNNDLEKFGTGMLRVAAGDGINGTTLTVHSGRLDVDAPDALSSATVNLKTDALFTVDQDLSAGTVNVQGGGVRAGSIAALGSGVFDWSGGGMLVMAGSNFDSAELPSNGKVDLVLGAHNMAFTQPLVLGDGRRLTVNNDTPTGGGGGWWVGVLPDLVLAGGATQGRVAMRYQEQYNGELRWLQLDGRVDMPDGTLIVGDTQDFRVIDNAGTDWTTVTQNGMVRLMNAANDIGKIDVQGGVLRVAAVEPLGGADVNVSAGATLWLYFTPTIDAISIGGNGTVQVGSAGTSTLTLTATASTAGALSPGASAGELTIAGNVTVANDGGGNYGRVDIEVTGDGGVGGTDHDVLDVSGTVNATGGEIRVALPLPGPGLKPSTPNWSTPDPDDVIVGDLGDMTVLAATTITGPFAVETLGATIGVDANPAMPGEQPDYHWMVKSGASLVDYSSPTAVVLKGADLVWMAMPGDANLDDSCDVSDLSLLAGSYRQSGNWLQGDFNFDGNVDVSDLSLLAGNFRTSNPYFAPGSGGSPVPEPVTLVLLGLGGLGLVARRRRK